MHTRAERPARPERRRDGGPCPPALLTAALLVLLPLSALAQADAAPERPAEPGEMQPGEMPANSRLKERRAPPERLKSREGVLLGPGETVDASDALDEMLDELAVDVARLGAANVSPILLERVRLSENMNPEFAAILEARLVAALSRSANVAVYRCIECVATRGRVENGAYVITRGVTRKEELAALARKYGAHSYLSVSLTLNTAPNSLALDVELTRAQDAAITFAEAYRIHPHTAMLYRGADTTQHREARLKDLEDRIAQRAQFGHGALFGVMLIPTEHPEDGAVMGPVAMYRLYEKFGTERQHRFGITAGGFLNTTRLAGAFLGAALWTRLTGENLYAPQLHIGGGVSGFVTGSPGNTAMLTAMVEYLWGHRIAVQGSLSYMLPFEFADDGWDVGGFCPQGGVAFLW